MTADPTPATGADQGGCIGNNPTCPCQDGDQCHYKTYGDSKAMSIPADQCGVLTEADREALIDCGPIGLDVDQRRDVFAAVERIVVARLADERERIAREGGQHG